MVKKQIGPIVLASGSPRRSELLTKIGLSFDVFKSEFEEKIQIGESTDDYVKRNALGKVMWVGQQPRFNSKLSLVGNLTVIGADTVVAIDGKVMEKPESKIEARQMLSELSDGEHQVLTGVCIMRCTQDGEQRSVDVFSEKTIVSFKALSHDEICGYLENENVLDKSGAYGIQGQAAYFAKEIRGSYTNIIGLPLAQVYERLFHPGSFSSSRQLVNNRVT